LLSRSRKTCAKPMNISATLQQMEILSHEFNPCQQ
jgi:hypothetical protein